MLLNSRGGAEIDGILDEGRGYKVVTFSDSGLALCLQAYQVDAIKKVIIVQPLDATTNTSGAPWLASHLSLLSSCNDLILEMAKSAGKQPLTSLAKVLVGGRFASGSIRQEYPSHEAAEGLRSCIEIWDSDCDEKVDHLQSGSNWRYLDASYFTSVGRSLSLTTNGRLVLTPGDVQEGDTIVVIKGFEFPYALRPAFGEGGKDGSTYRIIGPCYVEDIMDGKVFKSGAFKAAGRSDITIV